MHPGNLHGRGYTAALCAAAILATTGVLIRYLSLAYHIPALVLAFWRDVFVLVTVVPLLLTFRRPRPGMMAGQLPFLAGYGLVLALFNVVWTLSVVLNGAAIATVFAYCSGAFSVGLGRLLLKEPLTPAKLLATALSLGGCVLVAGAQDPAVWRLNLPGITAGGLTGLIYAGYSLLGRAAANRGLDPWTTLAWIFGFASIFLLLINLAPGGLVPGSAARPGDLLWLGRSLAGWGLLFLLAAGPTVAGFGLYLVSLVHLPSSIANLVVSLEPAFATLFAYVFLGERLGPAQAAGGLMILAAVIVLRLHELWRPAAQPLPGR